MIQIVVLGDLNLDIHAHLPSSLAPGDETRDAITVRAGGSAGTFARAAAALGASVTFIGAVGDDLVGDLLETSLTQDGIIAKLCRVHMPSGAVLAIEMEDDRSMVCARGANDGLTSDWVAEVFPPGYAHLHVSGYALLSDAQREAAAQAFALAADLKMTRSLDPPPASLIRSFGVVRYLNLLPDGLWLFPNRSEGELFARAIDNGDVVNALATRFPVGAYTLGADGARAWDGTTRHLQGSQPLPPVDTTGAGDVYAAAFVTRFLQSNDLAQANIDACAAATSMLRQRLSLIA